MTDIPLGSITCPSGRLVIADTGYLGMWSASEPPTADDAVLAGVDDPKLRDSIRAAADFAVVGPDAEAAARTFGRQLGTWLYDIPGHGIEPLTADFADHCREHGLDARLEREERVPHRERAERCARAGGLEFIMNGVPVVAIGDLPAGRDLDVTGTRRDYGRIGTRWETISINVRAGTPVSSRLVGGVGVDAARLSLIDADGLAEWRHEDPIDGLADVAFWGRSVYTAADHTNASLLTGEGDAVFGWQDLPVAEAVDRAIALQDWKAADPGRGLAIDFRPHSHHWRVMAQVRAAEHENGTIEVGGTRTMCFMTGWGDGFFPVYADTDAAGDLVRIRIVLGDDERRARMETLYDQWNHD